MRPLTIACLACCLIFPWGEIVQAGQQQDPLQNFWNDVAGGQDQHQTDDHHQSNDHHHSGDTDSDDNCLSGCLTDTAESCLSDISIHMVNDLFRLGGACGAASWYRVAPPRDVQSPVPRRRLGEPVIPFFRIDAAYRGVSGTDIHANDLRLEVGYGPIGAQFNESNYTEQHPRHTLVVRECYGLYRMSMGTRCEVDMGAGEINLPGAPDIARASFALPILIHSRSHLGIEFRPAWAARFNDYDIAAVYDFPYSSLKVGYRWMQSTETSLNGPYIGLSVRL